MKFTFATLLLLFVLQNISAQSATFEFDIIGGTPEQIEAIEYCGSIWSNYLESDVPINIRIVLGALGTGQGLGLTLANGMKDFPGAPYEDLWYPSCLANAIAGTDLKPEEADMDIFLNISYNYYYGLDGNPASNQHDFVSVVLHEIGHGIGITSLAKIENSMGSFGEITAEDFFPLGTSFPFPELDGRPSVFDSYIINSSAEFLIDETIFPNPSTMLEIEFTGNNLFFSGPVATENNNTENPRIFAPIGFQFGSSITHFDEDTYPAGSGNSLMTPYISQGEVEHEPGNIVLGTLYDIGWNGTYTSVENIKLGTNISIYPNPAQEVIYIQSLEEKIQLIQLLSIDGSNIFKAVKPNDNSETSIEVNSLPTGLYIIQIRTEKRIYSEKIMKH